MAGDEAKTKNTNSSRVELHMEMEIPTVQDLNIYIGTGNSESSSHLDSEVDSEAADQDGEYEYMYSPLNGDSDIENDLSSSSDESSALLVHEITCCGHETDTETDSDGKDHDHGIETGNIMFCKSPNESPDKASEEKEHQIFKTGHNPYKLMANDEEESNNDKDYDDEALLLLEEDLESDNHGTHSQNKPLEKPNRIE